MSPWWSDHPDLESLARRGRGELQHESIAAEEDAEVLRQRRRTLTDLCFEWMSRGDLVTVAAAGHQFKGQLIAVVNDLLVIAAGTLEVIVRLDNLQFARSDRRAHFEGTTGDRTVSSFRAALGRSEIDQSTVRLVGVSDAFDVTGIIEASTDDHFLVKTSQGLTWALPRAQTAFAIGETN